MINNVVLVGRITRDPELRKTTNGNSVVSFTLACNRRFQSQENGQQADFINCVAWNKAADNMANFVRQGDLLGVEGRIQTRNYKDQNDRTVYVTEVVCDNIQYLAKKRDNQGTSTTYQQQAPKQDFYQNDIQSSYESDFGSDTLDIASDDLPF
ncbi:MAG: single-stranded DNA-binding protein [Traorella sp.]